MKGKKIERKLKATKGCHWPGYKTKTTHTPPHTPPKKKKDGKKRKGWKSKKCFSLIEKTQGQRSPESVVTNRDLVTRIQM